MFRKAERKKVKLKMALCGPSGSGKTLGALKIAKGMGMTKIAVIDTENGSSELYSDVIDFNVCPLDAPFSPDKYIKAIEKAEEAGHEVLIIDSLSHAWAGEGGILDMHEKATQASSTKNSYTAWGKITPQHNKLINAILQSKMHVIVCMRTKTSYELVEENGKKKPIKIGLAPIQRAETEFEFTIIFDLSVDSHHYSASKDRTRLFDGKPDIISEKTGKQIMEWLDSGIAPQEDTSKKLQVLIEEIKKALDLKELEAVFKDAYLACKSDAAAIQQLIKTKDEIKAALTKKGLEKNKDFIDAMESPSMHQDDFNHNN